MKSFWLIVGLHLSLATALPAQRVEQSPFRSVSGSRQLSLNALAAPGGEPKPPISHANIVGQVLSGGAGGLAGAFIAFVPLALKEFGGSGSGVSDDAAAAAIVLGYYAGTVIGVQTYSRVIGLQGSWKATFIGAALGVLGGPAVLVTMPIGATIGFNRTRTARP